MAGLLASLRLLGHSLVDLVYPPICLGCDSEIDSGLVCRECRQRLLTNRLGVCPACGRPNAGSASCGRCRAPFCLARVRALGRYVPPYLPLVLSLKYDSKVRIAQVLGEALTALVESDPGLYRADLVCPVPLHPVRRRERGYNQAELLAREVAAGTGLRYVEALARIRNTRSQTGLPDGPDRQRNVRGAFALIPDVELEGTRVVLLDDVTTSGATLDAAARQLLKGGAAEVSALVVAAA